MDQAIEVSNLSFAYRSATADSSSLVLHDLSFSVRQGAFVSVLGPSGCGKSTLLQIIAGLLLPTTGTVRVKEPQGLHGSACSLVFQDLHLFYWLTAAGNVEISLRARHVPKEQRAAIVAEHLHRVGLSDYTDFYPHELSGGMRQRLALARAAATNTQILLLDEPFSHLDAQLQSAMELELLRLCNERHLTVCAVTHDLRQAARLSDQVLILSNRPGTIRSIVTIDLPKPRHGASEYSADFQNVEETLWRALEQPTPIV